MLDDGDGRVGEFGGKFKGRIGVVQIVVGQRLALDLRRRRHADAGRATGIERRPLMRVLAIAQFLKPAAGHRHRLAEGIPRHPVGDGLVIGGGAGKGLAGKTAAGLDADIAVTRYLGKHRVIIGRVADNGHEIMVLGRGAKHGGPANIDIFD